MAFDVKRWLRQYRHIGRRTAISEGIRLWADLSAEEHRTLYEDRQPVQ